jgi:hypothetical protein
MSKLPLVDPARTTGDDPAIGIAIYKSAKNRGKE